MTIKEFVNDCFCNGYEAGVITADVAKGDLDIFRVVGMELPEGITPEAFAEEWNKLVLDLFAPKHFKPTDPEWKRLQTVADILNAISYDPYANFYTVANRNGTNIIRWGGEYGGQIILDPIQMNAVLKAENRIELLETVKDIVADYRFIEQTDTSE